MEVLLPYGYSSYGNGFVNAHQRLHFGGLGQQDKSSQAALLLLLQMILAKITKTALPDFNINDSAIVLIDPQDGTTSWATSTGVSLVRANQIVLAHLATGLKMPLVLTSSLESKAQGPILKEIQKAAPDAFKKRVQRLGTVNAWDDQNFVKAVQATGRKNLIMAGVTTDVCIVPPASSAVENGYRVKVIADACGSRNQVAEEAAWRRLEANGVEPSSTTAIVAELVKNWATPAGAAGIAAMDAGDRFVAG